MERAKLDLWNATQQQAGGEIMAMDLAGAGALSVSFLHKKKGLLVNALMVHEPWQQLFHKPWSEAMVIKVLQVLLSALWPEFLLFLGSVF